MLARLCSKFFKLGFSSTWTENSQMYKLGFKDAERLEIKLPTFIGSWRKQRSSRKTSVSASLTTWKPLTMWNTENCRKFSMRWEYWTTLPVFWETRMHVKKEQLVLNMEQWFKIGKDYDIKCHSAYLTFMQSTSWEMLGWMNPKLESRLLGEISTTADMQMISF